MLAAAGAGAPRWPAAPRCGVKDRVTTREPQTGPATGPSPRCATPPAGATPSTTASSTGPTPRPPGSRARGAALGRPPARPSGRGWSEAELEKAQVADLAGRREGRAVRAGALHRRPARTTTSTRQPSIWHIEVDDGDASVPPPPRSEFVTTDATIRQLFPYVGPFDRSTGSSCRGRARRWPGGPSRCGSPARSARSSSTSGRAASGPAALSPAVAARGPRPARRTLQVRQRHHRVAELPVVLLPGSRARSGGRATPCGGGRTRR